MPSFKPKTNKTLIVDKNKSATLDTKHQTLLDEFHNDSEQIIPGLELKIGALEVELKKPNIPVEVKLDLKDKIGNLTMKIRRLKRRKNEYFLNNSCIIFDYFESKKAIANDDVELKTTVLDRFFKTNQTTDSLKQTEKHNSVKQYFIGLDDSFMEINDYIFSDNVCKFCNKGEMIPVDDEGIVVCNQCAKHTPFIVEGEKPSYKEPPKEVSFYAYKRINHFREILAQFQAKETTQIPDKVIKDVKSQIKKERIQLHQLTNVKAKDILKKLGYNKYYEHIPFIKDIIGIKPPVMTPELEETLCNLFMEIQAPYAKYCPDDRVNFLNYYYTVYKLCELLDQQHFLSYFPMLKDREKRMEQDVIWKKICDELDWEFIPTI